MSSSKGSAIQLNESLVKRFWSFVEKGSSCWGWKGYKLKGYGMMNSGHKTPVYAHRVSYAIHNPGAEMCGLVVMHLCNNPACTNPKHLELGSNSLNSKQAFRDGLSTTPVLRGEDCPSSRLTWAQVQEIRTRYSEGGITYQNLGEEYGISKVAVGNIIKGKTWAQRSGSVRHRAKT